MIEKKWYESLCDEEKAQYVFDFCVECEFYPCERVEEFCRFAASHSQDLTSDGLEIDFAKQIAPVKKKNRYEEGVTIVSMISSEEFEKDENTIVIIPTSVTLANECRKKEMVPSIRKRYDFDTDFLSYDREELKNGCIMDGYHVVQVECGRKTVTDGIGEHYKIETDWKHKIKTGTYNRWEPSQAVVISAQTGQGKNYFIENTLIPYVDKLNYDNKTKQKVLIISNRLALKCQINNRLRGNGNLNENEEGMIYHYKGIVYVMTYQSLLRKQNHFKRVQKDKPSRYIFVICDEAHFFTSDAMFNPYTEKILSVIASLFKKAVRIYMTATPYECLEYITKCEKQQVAFYHFERNYSYLKVNTYSEIEELYGEIVRSVARKEKWIIFIDDKEKCQTVKDELEKKGDEMNIPMKDADSEIGKIYAVNAESKADETYMSMLQKEKLGKGIDVLITTSVLDNGVNFRDIDNIVVSDMSKEKCLQMVGRARVNDSNDHINLYIKRFTQDYVRNRICDFEKQKEAYHEFELAYGDSSEPFYSARYNEYAFLHKNYDEEEKNWKNARHWFGRTPKNPNQIYPNTIAKSLMEKNLSRYGLVYQEMEEELAEIKTSNQGTRRLPGQKYLEYQLSWFGKKYCTDDDITLCGKGKAEKIFLDFLNLYVDGKRLIDKDKKEQFKKEFTELHDAVFPRADKNLNRSYGISVMNKILKKQNLSYKVISHSSYWEVAEFDWDSEKSE